MRTTGRYAPKPKLPLVVASGPTGGILEVAVSSDRTTYYKRYPNVGNYQRIPMSKARELVERMDRDCCAVPERLKDLNEDLVAELRARTSEPVLEPEPPRRTNWGRQIVTESSPSFTQL